MLVKKIGDNYEFESPTKDGAFIVKLIITRTGEEKLSTMPVYVHTGLEAQNLPPGTIRTAIGEERWQNFVRMKEEGFSSMFIDPHAGGSGVTKLTS